MLRHLPFTLVRLRRDPLFGYDRFDLSLFLIPLNVS
jgi:hypothetical protein